MSKLDISMLKKSNCQNTTAKPVTESVTQAKPVKKATVKKEAPSTVIEAPQVTNLPTSQPPEGASITDYPTQVGNIVLGAMEIARLMKAVDMDKVTALKNAIDTMSKNAKDIAPVAEPTVIPGTGCILSAKKERTYSLDALSPAQIQTLGKNGLLNVQISKVRECAKNDKEVANIVKVLDDKATYVNKGNTLETPYQVASTAIAKAVAYDKAGRNLAGLEGEIKKLILAIGADKTAEFGEMITNIANTFDRNQERA